MVFGISSPDILHLSRQILSKHEFACISYQASLTFLPLSCAWLVFLFFWQISSNSSFTLKFALPSFLSSWSTSFLTHFHTLLSFPLSHIWHPLSNCCITPISFISVYLFPVFIQPWHILFLFFFSPFFLFQSSDSLQISPPTLFFLLPVPTATQSIVYFYTN